MGESSTRAVGGELARQRDSRDLWISRGHLAAMCAGALVLAGTTFALGLTIGKHDAPTTTVETVGLAADRPLVELLARVESSSQPHGGVDRLTFPEVLDGTAAPSPLALPTIAPTDAALSAPLPTGDPVVVEPTVVHEPAGDAPRDGAFTIEVTRTRDESAAVAMREALRAAGVDSWLFLEQRDGQAAWRVEVGGYADRAAADLAMSEVVAKVKALEMTAAPTVVPRGH